MAPNPFTDETRSEVVSMHLEDMPKLRMPSSLFKLLRIVKPQNMSTQDYLMKGGLDSYLIHQISLGRYDVVQTTLGALFGTPGNGMHRRATDVVNGNGSDNGR